MMPAMATAGGPRVSGFAVPVTPVAPRAAETTGFAARLASWQSRNHLKPTGAVDAATLGALKYKWQQARPFIAAFDKGACPEAASAETLVAIAPKEGWGRKPGQLDERALAALRLMVKAARAEDPAIAADFRGVDVALRVGGQVMEDVELPGVLTPRSKGGDRGQRSPIEDHHLRVAEVGDIEKLLGGIS